MLQMTQLPGGPTPYQDPDPWPPSPPPRRGAPWWVWLLLGLGVVVALPCVTCVGFFMYVGAVGPDTAVYRGADVPSRYLDTMRDVGALETGERIEYFYSDGMTDIREGFYFVSDRRVVIYVGHANPPLRAIAFDEIADVHLARETSFFIDSEVTLELDDGSEIWFPVSSEQGRDERFVEAIRRGMEQANAP